MAIFRCSAGLALTLACLACSAPQSAHHPTAVAPITRDTIDHLVPKRDFVGASPARFEWTAAGGVDEYALTVQNEVDTQIFQGRAPGTSLEWPQGNRLDPGTYFWRVVGLSEGRRVADSGRAAFVVVEK